MPTYDYECQCGLVFEAFRSISDATVVYCPTCGSNDVRRKIGAGSPPVFKGDGFYATDYGKPKPKPQEP